MATEAAERRAVAVVRSQQVGAPLPPVEHHHDPLPCPRCSSSNTKFCYYNNYNFSQPRHFCKSCRRYWTHGGTLRDIPVGGASRKTPKRSRTSSSSATSSSGPTPINPAQPHPNPPVYLNGGFTTLLSGGGLALGGFGLGLGLEEYGLGRGVWAFPDHEVGSYVTTTTTSGGGDLNGSHNNSSGSGSNDGGGGGGGEEGGGRNDTWQVESGSGEVVGFVPADCFASLPELAISSTLLKWRFDFSSIINITSTSYLLGAGGGSTSVASSTSQQQKGKIKSSFISGIDVKPLHNPTTNS